jgi:hypothetical protein
MDAPIVPGRNYVYCGSFQLAWNELQESIVKAPIQLEGSPAMAAILNAQRFHESDLSPDCYLAMAGRVEDGIAGKVRRALAERFPAAKAEVPDARTDKGFYAYAYLQKALPFREAFDRLPEPVLFASSAGQAAVACFGFSDFSVRKPRDLALQDQVRILYYKSDNEFVIQLNTASTADELMLAKVPSEPTLRETIAAVRRSVEEEPDLGRDARLGQGESLIVPVVALNVERTYAELLGRGLQNPGWEAYEVTQACQVTRFRLDETGAHLASEGIVGIAGLTEQPRRFVFDKPFLVCLTQKGAKAPYFALWVESAEVLEKR